MMFVTTLDPAVYQLRHNYRYAEALRQIPLHLTSPSLDLLVSLDRNHQQSTSYSTLSMIETTPENECPILPSVVLQPDTMEMTKPLKQALEGAMCRSFSLDGDSSKEFLPEPDINRILSEKSILGALRTSCPGADFMRRMYASAIVKEKKYTKIFAILVLIGRADAIAAFRQNHLDDSQLPLAFASTSGEETSTLVRSTVARSSFDLSLMGLSYYESILLEETQWKFLAPVFARADLDSETRNFPASTILPFVMPDSPHGIQGPRNGCSKNSRIYQAHLHDGHHDFPVSTVAVKQLLNAGPEEYAREVEALKTFGGPDQPHVIELLATFKHGDTYYLVTPWAEHDLHGLFTEPPSSLACDSASAVKPTSMTAKQMLGVAEALKAIHYCRLKKRSIARDHETAEEVDGGYHGDIKPENILVENGQWKLADFGLSQIGRKPDSSQGDRPAGCSPAYRAPEHDVGKFDGQKADIWSLGCVMSVAATWMTLGRKGVMKFSANRQTKTGKRLDNSFFEVSKDQEKGTRVKLKAAVSDWISRLHRAPKASSFIHDLLDLIQDKMLEVDGSKRIACAGIVSSLEKMYEKCIDDPGYTEPAPRGEMSSWACRHELSVGTARREARSITVNVVEVPSPTQRSQPFSTRVPQFNSSYSSTGSYNSEYDDTIGFPLAASSTEPLLTFGPSANTMNQSNIVYGGMNLTISPDMGQLGSPNLEEYSFSFGDPPTSRPSLTVPENTKNGKRRCSTSNEKSAVKRHGIRLHRLTCYHREHLRRNHREPGYKCSRCQVRLSSAEKLNNHYNSEVQCQRQPAIVDDNMDDAQWSSCQGQMRGMNGAGKWGEIYKIIFGPTCPEVMPSPYRDELDELDKFCKFLDSQRQFQTCDSIQREIAICLKWIREFQDQPSLTQSSIKSEVPSLTEGLSNISTLSTDVMATSIDQEQIYYAYNPTFDSSCQQIGTMTQDHSVVNLQYLGCHLNFGP
ncbi:protein kinase [Colletotrichum costaricense]|uniref:Protein kinase n=1 Tax=Colletotrichum costaricense TaxID=1209916 RepID=A0AAJ0E5E3_9PEZI|nr:protein kinase [Colletotrichum costaricense]KAK1534906.1 protein kinase [Colletotrichum costaricense]